MTIVPNCPSVGSARSWAAASTGGAAPIEYRFYLRNATAGTWALLKDYDGSSTAAWTPVAPGTYFTQVWARSAGSSAAYEAWANSASCVVTAPVVVTSVVASAVSGLVSSSIGWTVTATGGAAPLEYRFWLHNATAGTWTLLRDYGTANTATWTPSAPGSYVLQAWVRSAGSTADYEGWANSAPVTIASGTAPRIASVTITPSGPLSVGVPATWSAAATGGIAPLQYRFWLRNDTAGTWTLLQDYGTAATAPWTPGAPGTYFAQVWVRSAGSTASWDAWSNSALVVAAQGPPAPGWTAVTSESASGQRVAWPVDARATGYRVYRATSRAALAGRLPAAPFVAVSVPPLTVAVSDPNVPQYYRVFGVTGSAVGEGGPVAVSTALQKVDAGNGAPLRPVTPSLWDVDGDGCLDLVGAMGRCDGRFDPYSFDAAGLGGLFAAGRVNRDSRLADYTGDGRADVFTNVYDDATDPLSRAILHVGAEAGGFSEDPGVAGLAIGGFGETVVAADFDNDGDVDLFLPHYSHRGDGGHNWLLVNDGAGHFTDVSASAGVASNLPYIPEGAQAIDFNQDGWIDISVSSHLFINNGDLTFTDRAAAVHVPARFDEGMKFLDVDGDGDFDLVHHDGYVTRLYRNVGGVLDAGTEVDGSADHSTFGYGLNVCDVNGDGFEDVVVANNAAGIAVPHVLLNLAGTLRRSWLGVSATGYNDLLACSDIDRSGLPDVLTRWNSTPSGYGTLLNLATPPDTIRLRVVGASGQRNQQGRVVKVTAAAAPAWPMLRVVESGSGYMAQNDYDLLVAAPWPGDYTVSVRLADGWFDTTARPGDALTIYADRRVEATPPPRVRVTSVTTPASTGVAGVPVTWTAATRFGVAPLQFRFWLRNETAGTWTLLQDYATSTSVTWTPAAAGSYSVQVWVRSAGSQAAWDAWSNSAPLAVAAP